MIKRMFILCSISFILIITACENPTGVLRINGVNNDDIVILDGAVVTNPTESQTLDEGSYELIVYRRGNAVEIKNVEIKSEMTSEFSYSGTAATPIIEEDFEGTSQIDWDYPAEITTKFQTENGNGYVDFNNATSNDYYVWKIAELSKTNMSFEFETFDISNQANLNIRLHTADVENRPNGLLWEGPAIAYSPYSVYGAVVQNIESITGSATQHIVVLVIDYRLIAIKDNQVVVDFKESKYQVLESLEIIQLELGGSSQNISHSMDNVYLYEF